MLKSKLYSRLLKALVIIIFSQIYITSALFKQLDWFTPVFGLLLIACFLLFSGGFVNIPNIIIAFLLYFMFSSITGLLFSPYFSQILPDLLEFLENLVFLYILYYISLEDIEFCPKTLVGISAVSCIIAVFRNYTQNGRLALHESSGINSLAFLLCLGIMSSVILLSKKRRKTEVIILISIITFELYVQTIIGARKYFLASCLCLGLWFVICIKNILVQNNVKHTVFTQIVLLLGLAVCLYFFLPTFTKSIVYERLSGEIDRTVSDRERINMYEEGFKILQDYPLIGLGYNSFVYHYGATSHSMYTELWAGTGIIGALIYIFPVALIFIDHFHIYSSADNKAVVKTNIIILIALLFLGTGIALQYESLFCFILAYLISFTRLMPKEDKIIIGKKCKYVRYS